MTVNIITLLISTGLNLLHTPLTEIENLMSRSQRNAEQNLRTFSTDFLRDCDHSALLIGRHELKASSIPRGTCVNCCPTKLSRDVKFVLYNKNNPRNGIPIFPFDESGAAKRAGVNPEWKTIIFIHGFSELSPGESGRGIVDAYLSRTRNYNVILLDWSELSSFPWYFVAVQNIKLVGEVLKNFIKLFNETGEIPIEKLHVVGFSLGCHLAAMAGKGLNGKLRIPRITALDPAFPEFPLQDRTKRLAVTDAEYVDVIHTNPGGFGFPISIGHADFYPNRNRGVQPGCEPGYLAQQGQTNRTLACSHLRAWRLYAESVRNPRAFPATQCEKWRGPDKQCNFTTSAFMGLMNKNSFGEFYLETNFRSPFGLDVQQQIE